MRVLGIDPGSNFLGIGCVEAQGNSFTWVGHRVIRVNVGGSVPHEIRLKTIFESVQEAIQLWQPKAIAVEEVFLAKNAQSALKLGQARGAAIVAAAILELPLFEYPATLVKQTVTGSGRAEKEQVQRMVRAILGSPKGAALEFEREDASDALAVAICHLQHRHKHAILKGSEKASAKSAKKSGIAPAREGKTIL
jgi:crossover junction endodeoxyribonuclease RuvC